MCLSASAQLLSHIDANKRGALDNTFQLGVTSPWVLLLFGFDAVSGPWCLGLAPCPWCCYFQFGFDALSSPLPLVPWPWPWCCCWFAMSTLPFHPSCVVAVSMSPFPALVPLLPMHPIYFYFLHHPGPDPWPCCTIRFASDC